MLNYSRTRKNGHSVFDIDEQGRQVIKHEDKLPIKIWGDVWIANNSSILKGVTLGSHNIVAYGSLVTKSQSGEHKLSYVSRTMLYCFS